MKNLPLPVFSAGPIWLPGILDLAGGYTGGHCQQHRGIVQDRCKPDPGG